MPDKRFTKLCTQCGKPYQGTRKQNNCSKKCVALSITTRVEVVCTQCGKVYQEKAGRAERTKYCSKPCRHLGERTRYKTKCKVCNKTLVSVPSHPRVYCGKECESVDRRGITGERITIYCELCREPFTVQPSRGVRRFCSQACASGGSVGKRKKETVDKVCLLCGVKFEVVPSRKHKKYCDNCDGRNYGAAYDKLKGEDHHWFRGGKDERYGANWDEQANKARKRDGNRCKVCNKRNYFFKNLPVHHIVRRGEFKTVEELETVGNRLDNLITLCPSCHRKSDHGTITVDVLRGLVGVHRQSS